MSRKWVLTATRTQAASVIVKANSREEALEKGRKAMESSSFWETYSERRSENAVAKTAREWHRGIPEIKDRDQ